MSAVPTSGSGHRPARFATDVPGRMDLPTYSFHSLNGPIQKERAPRLSHFHRPSLTLKREPPSSVCNPGKSKARVDQKLALASRWAQAEACREA